MNKRNGYLGLWLILALALGSIGACGSGDDDDNDAAADEKAPYGPPSKTSRSIFQRQEADGSFSQFNAEVVGSKTINGRTYWLAQIGDPTMANGLPPNEAYLTVDFKKKSLKFAGGKVYSTKLPFGDSSTPAAAVEMDDPLEIDLAPKKGEPQQVTRSGEVMIGGVPMAVTVDATYTLVDDNASVETAMGVVHGCSYITAEGTVSGEGLPEFFGETDLSGEVWVHDNLGVVAMVIKRPPYDDVIAGLLGIDDLGTTSGDSHMIQGSGLVSPSGSEFNLNTYDVNNAFDADKDQHALMLLELRYVDETLAAGTTPPDVNVEFGTVMGLYPSSLQQSPISFFHPWEEGIGANYWIAIVDQAAKNEAQNGIAYHIRVTASPASAPVRATGRIIYKLYKP